MKMIRLAALAAVVLGGTLGSFSQTWTQTSAPENLWSSIACSADGSKLFACGGGGSPLINSSPIRISTNGGITWTQTTTSSNSWAGIASSADGRKLVAIAGSPRTTGGIYTSTDGGLTWESNNIPARSWRSIASSADGSKLFAVTTFGEFYRTADSGANWISNAAPNGDWAIAASSDGTKLVAVGGDNDGLSAHYICISTDSGTSWITNTLISLKRNWWAVASSTDGRVLAAVEGSGDLNGHIFTSIDSGATWVANGVPLLFWQYIALSADGSKMIASAWYGSAPTPPGAPTPPFPIYTSTNTGLTWISNNVPNMIWRGVACSADGSKLMAVTQGTNSNTLGHGGIWTAQTTPEPSLNITPTNDLQLSWLIPSTNFVLQQSSDLANWSVVTNVPVLNLTNLQNQVTLPIASDNAFFRLSTP